MQINQAEEWLRLSALYGEMGEIELRDLARGYDGLTETAQQVLRDEMRKRGMGDPAAPPAPVRAAARRSTASPLTKAGGAEAGDDSQDEENGDEENGDEENGDDECEFTWRTPLCECEELEQAIQLKEALERAGIDAWIEAPNYTFRHGIYPRILVAADQLDEARLIADRPIPQEIADLARNGIPEYETPSCPACGTADPTLQPAGGETPTANHWLCESCGHEWTDLAGELDGEPAGDESGEPY